MKIDKAIEVLELSVTTGFYGDGTDFRDAKKLGIEALSYIKRSRVFPSYPINEILPGETKD